MSPSLKRRALLLLAALLAPLGAGCFPHATWLPDSSGFVYTGGPNKDQLILYDLAKGKARVLVEKDAGPACPAVSPDGKRIAVVLRDDDGDCYFIRVLVFDLDGKEVHRSPLLKWAKKGTTVNLQEYPEAYWGLDEDRLLVSDQDIGGIYDLKTKTVKELFFSFAVYETSPIRPDGKGFLGADANGCYFVDKEGKQRKIEWKGVDPFGRDDKQNEPPGLQVGMMLQWPQGHSSRWDGPVAEVSWSTFRLRIDTDKCTGTTETVKPLRNADDLVIQQQFQFAGGATIRAVEVEARYSEIGATRNGKYRIEVLKPGEKEPKVIKESVEGFLFCPSPDRKFVIVHGLTRKTTVPGSKDNSNVFFVVDAKGDVVAEIDRSK